MSKLKRSFAIRSEISRELDNINEKLKGKGIYWKEKVLGSDYMNIENVSNLAEILIFKGLKVIREALQNG